MRLAQGILIFLEPCLGANSGGFGVRHWDTLSVETAGTCLYLNMYYFLACRFSSPDLSTGDIVIMQLYFKAPLLILMGLQVGFMNDIKPTGSRLRELFKVAEACNTCGGPWWAPEPCPPPSWPCREISDYCRRNYSSRSEEVMRLSPPPPICCEGLLCLCEGDSYDCSCHNVTSSVIP